MLTQSVAIGLPVGWYQNSAQDAQKGDLLTHPTQHVKDAVVPGKAAANEELRRHTLTRPPRLPRQALSHGGTLRL